MSTLTRINGIQHLGVGTPNLVQSWKWYKSHFGLDIPMFDSVAEAELMKVYTNDKVVNKRAAMIINIQGGCPIEVIELKSEKCQELPRPIELGDLGINAGIVKTNNLKNAIKGFKRLGTPLTNGEVQLPNQECAVYLTDPNSLLFQVIESNDRFWNGPHFTNGVAGCIIGVQNIEQTQAFYGKLGYDKVVYEAEGVFDDFKGLPGGEHTFKRVRLTQGNAAGGGFGEATGKTWIELIQRLPNHGEFIYKDRIWGDQGFVHLGFDVKGMPGVEKEFTAIGHPFTCDSSNNLHMGKTRVHCTYIEDPDKTLIELIEVYKVPILEKWGVFLDVQKRNPLKPLPSWMLKAMRFNKIKDNYFEKNP